MTYKLLFRTIKTYFSGIKDHFLRTDFSYQLENFCFVRQPPKQKKNQLKIVSFN